MFAQEEAAGDGLWQGVCILFHLAPQRLVEGLRKIGSIACRGWGCGQIVGPPFANHPLSWTESLLVEGSTEFLLVEG